MCAWVQSTGLFTSMHIFVLLVLPHVTENGSFWQESKSLNPLAHQRQLVGWGAHRHATLNRLLAARPQKKLAVYSSLVFKACQNTHRNMEGHSPFHAGLIN